MLNVATLLNDFIPLPRIDFGKIWSRLKVSEPVRPIPPKWRSKPIAWIAHSEHDNEGWAGIVFASKNGQRLIYMPFREDGETLFDETKYLSIAPMDYIETATRLKHSRKKGPNFFGLYSEIQNIRTDVVSSGDRAWVEHCVHPEHGPSAPADTNTLG